MGKVLTLIVASGLLAVTFAVAHAAELNTGYVVSNQGALGITRAFDDDANTVLAFVDLDSQKPVLTDSAGKKIRFNRVDNYAVLPGKFDLVHVSVGNDAGIVRSAVLQSDPVAKSTPASTAPANPPVVSAVPPVAASKSAVTASTHAPAGNSTASTAVATQNKPVTPSEMKVATATTSNLPKASAPASASSVPTGPAAMAPAVKPLVAEAPKPIWKANSGSSFRSTVQSWSDHAGWQLKWEFGDVDFPIDIPIQFTGTFKEALNNFVAAYSTAETPPHACLYSDQQPKPLVRIVPPSIKCER